MPTTQPTHRPPLALTTKGVPTEPPYGTFGAPPYGTFGTSGVPP